MVVEISRLITTLVTCASSFEVRQSTAGDTSPGVTAESQKQVREWGFGALVDALVRLYRNQCLMALWTRNRIT